jgi:protein-disulfide isomerase
MRILTLLAFFVGTTWAQLPLKTSLLDKPALEQYLRHMEMWIPGISVNIDDPKPSAYLRGFNEVTVHLSYNGQGKDEHYYVSNDGKNIVKGDVYDTSKNPFQGNIDKIKLENQPWFGAAKPQVEMVVFGDFQCPFCKAEAETVRGNLLKTFPQGVRVTFKDFPLEAIHPWARAGSIAGRCVYKQCAEKFWNFHDWIYSIQETIEPANLKEKVVEWGGKNGLDAAALGSCIDTKATDAEVSANLQQARDLGISSTPTMFINGRKLEGAIEWGVLEQLIKLELDYVKGKN